MPRGIFTKRGELWIDYTHGGKRHREPAHTTDLGEAVALRKRRLDEGKVPTWADFVPEYLKACAHQKARAFKAERCKVLLEAFGSLHLTEITPKAVEQFQARRLAAGLAPATVNRDLAVLLHALGKAATWGDCPAGHVADLRAKCGPVPENNGRLRYLTEAEAATLLACCSAHLRPIVALALNTGMRKGELLTLRREDVDLRGRRITLKDAKAGGRIVRLNDAAVDALRSAVVALHSPYWFTYKGRRIGDVKTAFAAAVRRAKLAGGVCFHTLRHTAASHLAMAGANTETIRQVLGHTTTRMTERYTHLREDYVDEYLRRLYREA